MLAARGYRFVQVDVFPERVFGDNQRAVVFDAAGLATGTMQAIASEMNLADTNGRVASTKEVADVVGVWPRGELP